MIYRLTSLLLLGIVCFAFVKYQKSMVEPDSLNSKTALEDKNGNEVQLKNNTAFIKDDNEIWVNSKKTNINSDGNEIQVNNKKTIIDKNGNEIQVFDENTLFPKPGGGYCQMTAIKDKEEYFQAVEKPSVQCKDLRQFGLYKLCADDFKNKDNCVVLSFGISFDYSFEDLVVDKFGCQAYSFDPTMETADFVRKNGKDKYFNLGLSSFKGIKTMDYGKRKNQHCQVDRYVNIVNMLELADKEIDFFKIDVEGSELDFFLDTASNHPELIKNIRQFQLEFHNIEECCFWHSGNRKDTTQFDMMKIVDILHCHGFALTHTRRNPGRKSQFWYNGKQRSLCYVTTWIRV